MSRLIAIAFLLAASFISTDALSQSRRQSRKERRELAAQERTASRKDSVFKNFPDKALAAFDRLYERGMQEKVFLHTDKPYYCTGENIWFKGYIVNAVTSEHSGMSGVLYVELADADGKIVESARVGRDSSGVFHNNIRLDPQRIKAGEYTLRAYTRWMTNEDPGLSFSRTLRIEELNKRVVSKVSYAMNGDGSVTMTSGFFNPDLSPMSNIRVSSYLTYGDSRASRSSARTNDEGKISITFRPAEDGAQGKVDMELESPDAEKYTESVFLPSFSDDFDVQFLPEGGVLVPGRPQRLAFKAVGSNGLSADVTCLLYEDEREIAAFPSRHKGMGVIGVVPAAGKRYHAEVTNSHGIAKRIDIPVASSGCPLQVVQNDAMVMCTIFPTPDIDPARLALVVHCGGKLIAAEEFPAESSRMILNKEIFEPGIAHVSVVEKESGTPLSQRLIYIKDTMPVSVSIKAGGNIDGAREGVTLDISVADIGGNPVVGDFSLALTDASVVGAGDDPVDIRSYLKLSSDLKGYIEDPGYYFNDADPEAEKHLDLLMLTHGWSRFDISDILAGSLKPYDVPAETGPTITGEVRGVFGTNINNPTLIVADQYDEFSTIQPLEKNGRFRIDNVNVRDSAWVAVQVVRKSGSVVGVELKIDKPAIPELRPRNVMRSYRDNPYAVPSEYTRQFGISYNIENGELTGSIDPVIVRSRNYVEYKPEVSLDGKEKELIDNMTVRSGLLRLGATLTRDPFGREAVQWGYRSRFKDDELMRMSAGITIMVYDNQTVSVDEVSSVFMGDIDKIEVVRGSRGIALMHQLTGEAPFNAYEPGQSSVDFALIWIQSKNGKGLRPSSPPSIVILTDVGCKTPAEFYRPKYDVPEVLKSPLPDMRTTLAWEPDIVTDSSGNAKVFFYTADKIADYNVDLQGITADGKPCVYRTVLKRTK